MHNAYTDVLNKPHTQNSVFLKKPDFSTPASFRFNYAHLILYLLLFLFTGLIFFNTIFNVVYFYSDMEAINQAIRLNYTRISESIEAELTFLSALSDLTDDERFRQSIAEVIYSLNDLSDTINLQRRYLQSRYDAE